VLLILDCGDVFWKCKFLEWCFFIMDCDDVFWKCKLPVFFLLWTMVMYFGNASY
jgi:hypothetical protein